MLKIYCNVDCFNRIFYSSYGYLLVSFSFPEFSGINQYNKKVLTLLLGFWNRKVPVVRIVFILLLYSYVLIFSSEGTPLKYLNILHFISKMSSFCIRELLCYFAEYLSSVCPSCSLFISLSDCLFFWFASLLTYVSVTLLPRNFFPSLIGHLVLTINMSPFWNLV